MSTNDVNHAPHPMRLIGRHALLTGVAGGIGFSVLEAYLREGARCTAVDLPQVPSAGLLELMAAYPATLHYVAADVAQQSSIDAMMHAANAKFGPVEILFNNAATFTMGPLLEQGPADFDFVFNVNVKGMFFVMQAVLKDMVTSPGGTTIAGLAELEKHDAGASRWWPTTVPVRRRSSATAKAPHWPWRRMAYASMALRRVSSTPPCGAKSMPCSPGTRAWLLGRKNARSDWPYHWAAWVIPRICRAPQSSLPVMNHAMSRRKHSMWMAPTG